MRNASEIRQQSWTAVCGLSEIVPNTGVCVLYGGRQVAVFRLSDGSVYAISNYDPFSKANVLSRGILGDRAGRPKVASPIYKQSFCLQSGMCFDDDAVSVTAYEVRVRDGIVELAESAPHMAYLPGSGTRAPITLNPS